MQSASKSKAASAATPTSIKRSLTHSRRETHATPTAETELEEEEVLGSDELKAALVEALRSVGPSGAFATSGQVLDAMPPFTPLISVSKGAVGRLGLPLCEAQGKQLYAAGTPAPHGLGQATVLNPAVRSARQIDASAVTIGGA